MGEEIGMDLDDEEALRPEYILVKPPTQLSPDVIQRHKHYGLAVVGGASGICIDREANFWDIEEMLRSFFPALFDWFEDLPKVDANPDNGFGHPEHLPQWLLCTKLPGRSSGISIAAGLAFPTGSDIDFNVQTKRSGFRENILILSKYFGASVFLKRKHELIYHLATRTPVPPEILNKWQKRVGKKPVKSTPYRFPSVADDSDSDFPAWIPPVAEPTYLSSSALPDGRSVNALAGPSSSRGNGPQVDTIKPEMEIIDIRGRPFKFHRG